MGTINSWNCRFDQQPSQMIPSNFDSRLGSFFVVSLRLNFQGTGSWHYNNHYFADGRGEMKKIPRSTLTMMDATTTKGDLGAAASHRSGQKNCCNVAGMSYQEAHVAGPAASHFSNSQKLIPVAIDFWRARFVVRFLLGPDVPSTLPAGDLRGPDSTVSWNCQYFRAQLGNGSSSASFVEATLECRTPNRIVQLWAAASRFQCGGFSMHDNWDRYLHLFREPTVSSPDGSSFLKY